MKKSYRLLASGLAVVGLAMALALLATWGQDALAQGGIIHVDADATGTNDGSSWTDAFTTLQPALDAATATDQIWVASGVYTPTLESSPGDPRSATLQLKNGVALYGGFDPDAGDVAWEDRDWATNATILSGDLGVEGDVADNAYHVFFHPDGTNLDSTAILDGFTITGGNANGAEPHNAGAGMYNDGSSPALANCTFSANSAGSVGGGMYNSSYASPTLTNCTFEGNSAGDEGGGMLNDWHSSPQLTDCTFTANSSTDNGGGMSNGNYTSPTLVNCTFTGNSATSDGGGIYNRSSSAMLTDCTFTGNSAGSGGGIYNFLSSSSVLVNCTFSSNSATGGGGGIYNQQSSATLTGCTFEDNTADGNGGGMLNDNGSSPAMTGCTFSGNSAGGDGGGIYNNSGSSPTLTGCTFEGNSADSVGGFGGGMLNSNSSPVLTDCTFSANSAGLGGAIYNATSSPTLTNCTFSENIANTDGGAIHNDGSAPALTNCTFWGNTAAAGGGIYNGFSSPTLTNCILWGDTPDELHNAEVHSSPVVTYSDIQGGYTGAGNIQFNPLFVDPSGGNLRLQLTSPAIDAGDNDTPGLVGVTTDLAGLPRRADVLSVPDTGNGTSPIVDMGAYETPAETIFVDQDATGDSNGSSWDDAFTDLQDALTLAMEGYEIWVAAGTYTPTVEYGGTGDRSRSYQLVNGVALYGGFDPDAGDVAWEDRDWATNATILSGDLGVEGDVADNAYHVFFHPDGTNLDSTAILDGFTITGGNANGSEPHNAGAGMYNDGSSPALANCTFSTNSATAAGGGIHNQNSSSPELTDCTFTGNSSANNGGAIYNDGSSPTLTNCTFSANSAATGGGVYNQSSSSPVLTDCAFTGNSATAAGGAIYNDDSAPTLTNCTFSGNSATDGGGIYNAAGSSPALTGCTFSGNSADSAGGLGGGMLNSTSSPALADCTFSANSADSGGGIYNANSSPTLTNCIFSDNTANTDGGALYNDGSSPVLINCTIWGNSAVEGGGIYNGFSSPTLTNCILWADTPGEIFNADVNSAPAVTYSDIQGGCDAIPGNICGAGNIDADPRLLDPSSGDFHLGVGSPCIDAGDNDAPDLPDYDFEGDDRILDGDQDGTAVVDMGVDETIMFRVLLPLVLKNH